MKDFHCRDAGMKCDFVARGESKEEILRQAGEHAQRAHHMAVTPELEKHAARAARALHPWLIAQGERQEEPAFGAPEPGDARACERERSEVVFENLGDVLGRERNMEPAGGDALESGQVAAFETSRVPTLVLPRSESGPGVDVRLRELGGRL